MTLVIILLSMSTFNERLMDVLLVFLLSVCGNVWFNNEICSIWIMHFNRMSELCKPGLVWYLKWLIVGENGYLLIKTLQWDCSNQLLLTKMPELLIFRKDLANSCSLIQVLQSTLQGTTLCLWNVMAPVEFTESIHHLHEFNYLHEIF